MALLVFVMKEHIALHENSHVSYNATAPIDWLQPLALDNKYPIKVSNHYWKLTATEIEKLLWQLNINEFGDLVIRDETIDVLQQMAAVLPNVMTSKEWQRLAFLIKRSAVNDSGEQVAQLLQRFYFYQQEYKAYLLVVNKAKADQKLALLKQSRAKVNTLQAKYFGVVTAEQLFYRKNLTTNYLNDRQIISLNKNLSKVQKEKYFLDLKEHYQQHLSAPSL